MTFKILIADDIYTSGPELLRAETDVQLQQTRARDRDRPVGRMFSAHRGTPDKTLIAGATLNVEGPCRSSGERRIEQV